VAEDLSIVLLIVEMRSAVAGCHDDGQRGSTRRSSVVRKRLLFMTLAPWLRRGMAADTLLEITGIFTDRLQASC
jgi:hypothetical protein